VSEPVPDPRSTRLLAEARTAVLATIDPDHRPRLVPICFVALDRSEGRPRWTEWPDLYTPIDEKPKAGSDPHALARLRDIVARPEVFVLVDRWNEDWTRLAWLRLRGTATVLEATDADAAVERERAIGRLRAKYPQYRDHDLSSRPLIRIAVDRASTWEASGQR
jgi:PPOX class probable F420-dependent enzyme